MMRYITRLSVLLLVLLSCSSALAGPRYVRMVLGTREITVSPRAVLEDDAVYAPADILKSLGANFVEGKRKVSVIHGDETRELDLSTRNGSPMVRIDDVAKLLDLDRSWNESTSTLTLLGKLVSVDFEGSTLIARTTVPVSVSQTRLWSDPWKISIDLAGAKVATVMKSLIVGGPVVSEIRVGQFEDTTARIVIDLNAKRSYRVLNNGPSREIKIVLGDGPRNTGLLRPNNARAEASEHTGSLRPNNPRAEASEHRLASVQQPEGRSIRKPDQPAPVVKPEPMPVTITAITPEPDGDDSLVVRVTTNGTAAFNTSALDSPPRAVIDVENATLDMPDSDITVDHRLLKTIRLGQHEGSVRLVLETPGVPTFFAEPDGSDILIKLRQPSGFGGKLSDKIIVLDPGHGGNDPGAGAGGVREKDLNLSLARAVQSALEDAGVRVVLTRGDDRFIPLKGRPAVADQCGADFFISLHCNAIGGPNKKSGIETYYSSKQAGSPGLASAIHGQVINATAMTDRKARLRPGLAVLRNSNVPAILLEAGFIDCTADRNKLCDESWRSKLAQGVVNGLRLFVEGTIVAEEE